MGGTASSGTTAQASVGKNTMRASPEYRGNTVVTVDIAYPQVAVNPIPASGVAISGWYQENARRTYAHGCCTMFRAATARWRESVRQGYPFHPSDLHADFTVTYNAGNYLSLFTDCYEYTGGAHGTTVRRAEIWNLAGCCRMRLDGFFRGAGWRDIFLNGIYAQINAQIAQGNDIFFDGYQAAVRRFFDPCRCYLTPGGFAIFFPQVSIAPHAAGILSFVVPYADFDGLLCREL